MDFRTVIAPLSGMKGLIRHGEPILLVGSCFTDNIGACLFGELFDVYVNPFGPLYNPRSILSAFRVLAGERGVGEEELVEREGMFHSFMFHSRFSGPEREQTARRMTGRIRECAAALRGASCVIITLGTTRTFSLRDNGEVVANCHKFPASMFDAGYMSLDEVADDIRESIDVIRAVNSTASIIFTVSPLRYSELGAHGNQLSKSKLLLGIDRVAGEREGVGYFPAYEVMMDDLRDYRFYAEDMKHPTPQAVGYIYELFRNSYFDEATMATAREAAALTRRLSHSVMTSSPEMRDRETEARRVATDDLTRRFPELKQACKRYINSLSTNGI